MTDESYENALAAPWFWDLSIGDQVWIVGGVRLVEIFRDRLSDLSDDFDEAQILQSSTPAEAAETARRLEIKFKAHWTLDDPDHPHSLSDLGRAITLASIIAETIEENFPSAAMIAFAAGRPVQLGPFPPSETADLY